MSLIQQVWGGVNITAEVLEVNASISSPTCNATGNCTAFVAWIPTCETTGDSPACWCANQFPLHYCAICMSSPTDNTTTPEQTANAGNAHAQYHVGCNAYFAFLNGSATSSSSSIAPTTTSSSSQSPSPTVAPDTGGSSNINSGALAGIIIGGVIGLALILVGAWLTYRWMQNKHERVVGPPRSSFYAANMSHTGEDPKYAPGSPGPIQPPSIQAHVNTGPNPYGQLPPRQQQQPVGLPPGAAATLLYDPRLQQIPQQQYGHDAPNPARSPAPGYTEQPGMRESTFSGDYDPRISSAFQGSTLSGPTVYSGTEHSR